MDKKILDRLNRLCPCCMEEHEVFVVEIAEQNIFKEIHVKYPTKQYYCNIADEYYTDEVMLAENDIAMKNAYRKEVGLLTSVEIHAIREKYGISQSDLCSLLGWGQKTIAQYEGHQVQDAAHDTILRKLANDPEWFLSLLEMTKNSFSKGSYVKYYQSALSLFEEKQDVYLRKSLLVK